MFSVHAAVFATDELARLLELGATEETTDDATEDATEEIAAALEEATTGVDERLDDDTATLAALELAGATVPQPIGWVETTMSSIQTSAERPLKLWKPNMT